MSLSKNKFGYSNNCLLLSKRAVPFAVKPDNLARTTMEGKKWKAMEHESMVTESCTYLWNVLDQSDSD